MAVFRQLSSAFSVKATINNIISIRHVLFEMVIAHKTYTV